MSIAAVVKSTNTVDIMAHHVGIDKQSAESVFDQVLPAVTQGIRRQVEQPGSAEGVWNSLSDGHYQEF